MAREGRERDRGGGRDRDRDRGEESELIEKLVGINRVAKVVKGGRRFGFAALVVVGDGRGRVGYGSGKAREVPEAIRKATEQAKRTMTLVRLRGERTLHHDVRARFGAGRVMMRAAPAGTGIIAGGPMRAIFEAVGIKDVVAKSTGSSNPYNMVKATVEALKLVESPRQVANRRGLRPNDIAARRDGSERGARALAEEAASDQARAAADAAAAAAALAAESKAYVDPSVTREARDR